MTGSTVIPFGPQHPVLPEPIQVRLVLDEERVVEARLAIGYVHRGLEKLAEQKDFVQNVFLIERTCGICSFIHALSYCQGIEDLMGIAVPPRARYLRVVWSELNRLHSHLLWLGLLADSFGFENVFMQVWRVREQVLDLAELTSGARIMLNTCCLGGVRRDLDAERRGATLATMDRLRAEFDRLLPAIVSDYTVQQRLVGVGAVARDQAYELGALGPTARATGLPMDFRTTGYAAYGELGVTPITETAGDAYARLQVRTRELYQSVGLIREAILRLPDSELVAPVKGFPSGETLSRAEQPRGEVVYYLKANGTARLDRVRIRTPTFANLAALLHMLKGCRLADVPVIILSVDPCISCAER